MSESHREVVLYRWKQSGQGQILQIKRISIRGSPPHVEEVSP